MTRREYSWAEGRWYVVSKIGRTVATVQGPPPPVLPSLHADSCPATLGVFECNCGLWPTGFT